MNPEFENKLRKRTNPNANISTMSIGKEKQDTSIEEFVATSNQIPADKVVGRKMTDKERENLAAGKHPFMDMSYDERKKLAFLGVQSGEDVPEVFTRRLNEYIRDNVQEQVAQGVDVENIKEIKLEDLPQDQQASLRALLDLDRKQREEAESTAKELAKYPAKIAGAIAELEKGNPEEKKEESAAKTILSQMANKSDTQSVSQPARSSSTVVHTDVAEKAPVSLDVPLVNDLEFHDPSPGHTDTGSPVAKVEPVTPTVCNTCGFDPSVEKQIILCKHCQCDASVDPDTFNITLADKRRYIVALGCAVPFEKEYTVFNDTITVRFRGISDKERRDIYKYVSDEIMKDMSEYKDRPLAEMYTRIYNRSQAIERVIQTKAVFSNLKTGSLNWSCPEDTQGTFKDWQKAYPEIKTYDDLLNVFEECMPNDGLQLAIHRRWIDFNLLERRLDAEVDNENFWKGI